MKTKRLIKLITELGHQKQPADEMWRLFLSPVTVMVNKTIISQVTFYCEGLSDRQRERSDAVSGVGVSERTHVGRPVGAHVDQDGLQVGKDLFFGHVELHGRETSLRPTRFLQVS